MLTYFTSNLDSMTRILLIKTLSNLELLSADLLYTDIYVLMVSMVSIKNIRNIHAVSTNQIADILHFKDIKIEVRFW